MFEFVKEIPVTFEPHWADVVLLGLTVASISASVWVGFLAYRNGKRATDIAEGSKEISAESIRISEEAVSISRKAAEREAARIEKEDLQIEWASRERVARAMFRAFNIADYFHHTRGPSDPHRREIRGDFNHSRFEALSDIDLYSGKVNEPLLRDWFMTAFDGMSHVTRIHGATSDTYAEYHKTLLEGVSLWNQGAVDPPWLFAQINRFTKDD